MQVASLQETHVFSPHDAEYASRGLLARGIQSTIRSAGQRFPPTCPLSPAADRAESWSAAASPPPGVAAITAAGPNNAANVWNRRNLFTYTDGLQITKGRHQISAGVWFQRLQDNENTASRQLGQASFTSLTTFLQGTVEQLPGGAQARLNWAGEAVRRLVRRGRHPAAPQSDAAARPAPRVHHRLE